MRPPCPGNWNYENFAGHKPLMQARVKQLLLAIRRSVDAEKIAATQDTRPIHGALFEGLTFPQFEYYAGHYRGENFWCLDEYEVRVPGDSRVGHPSGAVPIEMDEFANRIPRAIDLVERLLGLNAGPISEPLKLIAYVQTVAAIFVEFLEIHPYANGNGHIARFIVLALLGRKDLYPQNAWPIDPRPMDPPYTNLITQYRNGNRDPLVQFLIAAL